MCVWGGGVCVYAFVLGGCECHVLLSDKDGSTGQPD
jgi:hypothetical protein